MIPSVEKSWTTCEGYICFMIALLELSDQGVKTAVFSIAASLLRIYMQETLRFLLMTDRIHRSGCALAKLPCWPGLIESTCEVTSSTGEQMKEL